MQGMLKKPTQEESQAKRTGAVQQLGAMARTVDRYTAGLSIQKAEDGDEEPAPRPERDGQHLRARFCRPMACRPSSAPP